MKKLLVILLIITSFSASAQDTLLYIPKKVVIFYINEHYKVQFLTEKLALTERMLKNRDEALEQADLLAESYKNEVLAVRQELEGVRLEGTVKDKDIEVAEDKVKKKNKKLFWAITGDVLLFLLLLLVLI